MRLTEYLKGLEYEVKQGDPDREISGVVYDSRKLAKDCLFVCIEGANFDGHSAVVQAAEAGAAAIVVCKDVTRSSRHRTPDMPWPS